MALLLLRLDKQAFDIYLVFFGLWLTLTGCLIIRSLFLPRLVGMLAALAGLSYVLLLIPPLADYLYPYYLAPDTIGEPVLIGWLLIAGVNTGQWLIQAGRTLPGEEPRTTVRSGDGGQPVRDNGA